MSKQLIHSYQDKLDAVYLIKKQGNIASVARFLGIYPTLLYTWYRQYQYGGPSALMPKSCIQQYRPEMRIAIVEDLLKKNVSLQEASAIFGVSSRTLSRWLRLVKERGFTALFDTIPNHVLPGMPNQKKKKDEPLTELEQLREENKRLRAELDLIKKVDALVSKRCNPTRRSALKPSKD